MSVTVYKFKAFLADDKKIHREIRIQADQTFKELHHSIMKAFQLGMLSGASFYSTKAKWEREKKIALSKPAGDTTTLTMDNAKIEDFVNGKNEKFVYECKTENPWTFHLEVIDTEKNVDLDSTGRFPKWEDTSKLSLPIKKKPAPKPVIDDDDDFDEFESDDSFGKGFDDIKSGETETEVESEEENTKEYADEPYEEEDDEDDKF